MTYKSVTCWNTRNMPFGIREAIPTDRSVLANRWAWRINVPGPVRMDNLQLTARAHRCESQVSSGSYPNRENQRS
jgi:hypothetical protein